MANPTLVTAKVHPDLGGVACTLAYAHLLNCDGFPFGEIQSEVDFFIAKRHLNLPYQPPPQSGPWQSFILVDASSLKGMPPVVQGSAVIEVIDHRQGDFNSQELPHAKSQIELVGAAATLIVERYQASHTLPLPDHAQLLYGAIYHNTLNFLSSNTTPRDKQAALFLEQQFALSPRLAADMFTHATAYIQANLSGAILQDAKEMSGFKEKVCAYQLVTWGLDPRPHTSTIASVIQNLDTQKGSAWSYLSVIDISTNSNYFYCPYPAGQRLLSQIITGEFDHDWLIHSPVLLRKQLMPQIKSLL